MNGKSAQRNTMCAYAHSLARSLTHSLSVADTVRTVSLCLVFYQYSTKIEGAVWTYIRYIKGPIAPISQPGDLKELAHANTASASRRRIATANITL
jgi:hypothetical protein